MTRSRSATPRVLVVDDDASLRNEIIQLLRERNPTWEFIDAGGKEEAVVCLHRQREKKEPFALVLTDLKLEPDRDDTSGMDVLREAIQIDPLVKVILYTGYNELLERYGALDAGAFDVVEKSTRQGIAFIDELNAKGRSALKYRQIEGRVHFLSRYFDKRVFATLEENPDLLDLKKRTVTICFWDINGFSRLSEQFKDKPELVSGFLKDYCEAVSEVIFEHEGVVDKFIGDGVMALFGVFGADPAAAAVAAVRAAAQIHRRFEALAEAWKSRFVSEYSIEIGLRCGMHTGDALVGNAGTERRDQFTALGHSVNLAARFEGVAGEMKVPLVISNRTKSLVEGHFRVEFVKRLEEVKNIKGPFDLFQVKF